VDWQFLREESPGDRRRLLSLFHAASYSRGQPLFRQGDVGDSLMLITRGRVVVRVVTPSGETVTFALLGPGDVVGELALVDPAHSRRAATVIALEQVETLVLDRAQFKAARSRETAVDRLLVAILATRVRLAGAQLLEALYTPVRQRVARRLLATCRQYGGRAPVTVPLTQADLAELAGAKRPTVNQVLRALQREGIVSLGRARITVHDFEALERHG
jgi:CRP/FNR family transcriptional regulator, cyclic AMP receptor protein